MLGGFDVNQFPLRGLCPSQPCVTFPIAAQSVSALGVGGLLAVAMWHASPSAHPAGRDTSSSSRLRRQSHGLKKRQRLYGLSFKATSSPFGCSVPPRLPGGEFRKALGEASATLSFTLLPLPGQCRKYSFLSSPFNSFHVFEKDHSSCVDSCQPPVLLFLTLSLSSFKICIIRFCLLAFDMKILSSSAVLGSDFQVLIDVDLMS